MSPIPCQYGRFPYPDENVFAVFGADLSQKLPLLEHSDSQLIVSTRADLAGMKFEVGHVGMTALVTVSLRQVRAYVREMRAHPVLQTSSFIQSAWGVQPFAVTHTDAKGYRQHAIVVAHSVDQAKAISNAPNTALAVPLDLLEELQMAMDAVQSGVEKAPYAWDLSAGGEWEASSRERRLARSNQESARRVQDAYARWSRMGAPQQALYEVHA